MLAIFTLLLSAADFFKNQKESISQCYLLLFIDFDEDFDSVSWLFISKVLKLFNFGPSIIKWITVLNNNACPAVTQ